MRGQPSNEQRDGTEHRAEDDVPVIVPSTDDQIIQDKNRMIQTVDRIRMPARAYKYASRRWQQQGYDNAAPKRKSTARNAWRSADTRAVPA